MGVKDFHRSTYSKIFVIIDSLKNKLQRAEICLLKDDFSEVTIGVLSIKQEGDYSMSVNIIPRNPNVKIVYSVTKDGNFICFFDFRTSFASRYPIKAKDKAKEVEKKAEENTEEKKEQADSDTRHYPTFIPLVYSSEEEKANELSGDLGTSSAPNAGDSVPQSPSNNPSIATSKSKVGEIHKNVKPTVTTPKTKQVDGNSTKSNDVNSNGEDDPKKNNSSPKIVSKFNEYSRKYILWALITVCLLGLGFISFIFFVKSRSN